MVDREAHVRSDMWNCPAVSAEHDRGALPLGKLREGALEVDACIRVAGGVGAQCLVRFLLVDLCGVIENE